MTVNVQEMYTRGRNASEKEQILYLDLYSFVCTGGTRSGKKRGAWRAR